MSAEQVALLDKLGFRWQLQERRKWEDCAAVAEFKAKHGHCNVPDNFRENPSLGNFVNNMRAQRRMGLLSAERIAKLDKLGFMWSGAKKTLMVDGISEPWRTRFADLLRYKEVHGNCDVPTHSKEDRKLANWISQQRQYYNRGSLHATRVKLLEKAGVSWAGRTQRWQE